MTRFSRTACAAIVAGALLGGISAPSFAQDKAAPDKVVATVNGTNITEGDLAVAESEVGADMGSLPPAQKRMSLLEFLIDNQLFADAAAADKLDQSPDFAERLAYLKRRALRELYFDKVIKAAVADADARKIYDEQVKQLKPEEEVQARHILVDTEEKAKELEAKLKAGGDFAALAKEFSKDPGSKDDGGNLGYFGKGQMVPQFEEAVFKLQKGEVSGPIKTQFGWHIVKLEDRRTRQPPAFDIVKDRIVQSLLLQKAQQSAQDLRSKAKIDIVDPDIKKSVDERNATMGQMHGAGAAKPAEAAPAAASADKPADKPADAPADTKPADATP